MVFTASVSWKYLAAAALFACAAVAQPYEIGGAIGYGVYHDGTIFSPGATAAAGIRNRFAAGAVLGEDLYEHMSGEVRYLYHDGHPFLSSGEVKTDMQGQSHTLTYEFLFHLRDRDQRLRPFVAAGAGVKGYVVAGPAPVPQPLAKIATLETQDQWKFVAGVGGGVKYRLGGHVLVRADLRDYLTTFPRRQIAPAASNTARGVFQQFTLLFGASWYF